MRKYFTSGIAILLPIILTFVIVVFLMNFLTKPFMGLLETVLAHQNLAYAEWLHRSQIFRLFSQLVVLGLLVLMTILVGFIARLLFLDYLFRLSDAIFHRLPFFNKIYKATQDVLHGLLSANSTSFSQVVFVPFPSSDSLSIGLVTKEFVPIHFAQEKNDLIPVFVPGTPNPSVGFMLMFRKEDLIFVNMKIEDAMKFVVSCGVVMPDAAYRVISHGAKAYKREVFSVS